MIQIRTIDREKDLPVIDAWRSARAIGILPPKVLPQFGLFVEWIDGDLTIPIAAAWVDFSNSCSVAFLQWLVTNPEAPARTSMAALKMIVEAAVAEVTRSGYGTLFCNVPVSRLLDSVLTEAAFTEVTEGPHNTFVRVCAEEIQP